MLSAGASDVVDFVRELVGPLVAGVAAADHVAEALDVAIPVSAAVPAAGSISGSSASPEPGSRFRPLPRGCCLPRSLSID